MKNLRSTFGQFALITVFVSDFRTKATNLVDNLAHSRVRLIQAVLRTV
jgi:hypothetical protein